MTIKDENGRWYYRFKRNGVTYEKSTGLAAIQQNLNAAKAVEAARRVEVERGLDLSAGKGITFQIAAGEFLLWCQGEYQSHPNSALRINGSFSSLKEFFGNRPLGQVTSGEIEKYKTHRATVHQVKDCTIRNDLNALSLFLQYCGRQGWRSDNPLLDQDPKKKVKRPSNEDAIRIHVITEDEERAYFKHARGSVADVAKLILLQGPRPDEIMSLSKASYKRDRKVLAILGGKTKAARRELHLCAESIDILERRMKTKGPWLFPGRRGPERHVKQLNTVHDSVCQDAAVSFVLYDFRHTFATRFLTSQSADIATLQAIMGHSSIAQLQKYLHPTSQHQRAGMDRYQATRPQKTLRRVK